MCYYFNIMSTTIWRLRVIMETSNNNMAAMRYYGNVMTTTKKETSSVYDCTVEDVEYICNSKSTLMYICNKLSLRVYCCCCRCILHLQQYSRRLNLFLFSCWGSDECLKVPDLGCRWVLKNFPAPLFHRSSCVHTHSTVPNAELRRP